MLGCHVLGRNAWQRNYETWVLIIRESCMAVKNASGRFSEVDVLRAFAVGIVMIHHFYSEKFFLAGFGVTLFFVLSSFFATNSLLRFKARVEAGRMRRADGLKTFYLRRWLR